jgi:Domain of unknown function (DUF4129)
MVGGGAARNCGTMGAPGVGPGAREHVAEDRQPERRGPPGHGSAKRGRGLLPVAAAVGLLALVAVGSLRGPLGSGRGRPSYPADLVDSLVLLLFLAMIAAGVLAVIALWPDRHLPVRSRRAGSWNLILPMAAVLLLWLFRDLLGLDGGERDEDPVTTLATPTSLEPLDAPAEPGVVPLVVAAVAVLAMVAIVVAQLRADRRRRRPPATRAERLVGLLDDTLEDLERDPDPRRAVIAAWARMERGLAAAGLPRRPAEAPFEYAARVLETSLARRESVHRLTGLFERAKFSQHAIGPADRDEAIAALRAVRRELVEAAELAARAEAAARAAGGPVAGGGDGR